MTNKPTVSTRTMGVNKKVELIVAALRAHPEGATPKTIALMATINVNTVKSLLPKMSQVQKVSGLPGYYQSVVERGHDMLLDWNFHNCVLSCPLPSYNGDQVSKTKSFGLVNYEFTIGAQSKQATLRVHTDHPLNVSSLCSCSALFLELIEKHTGLQPAQSCILIKTVEFNKDFQNLRLDGLSTITVEHMVEQFKLYQKEHGLRLERKLKVPVEVDAIMAMLTNSAAASDIHQAIAELTKGQNVIIDSERRNYAMLLAFMKKLAPSGSEKRNVRDEHEKQKT